MTLFACKSSQANVAIERQLFHTGISCVATEAEGRGRRDLSQGKRELSMKDEEGQTRKKVDLGRCGEVTLHLSANKTRLLLEFDCHPEGLDKTGVNGLIDALKKVREKMDR
jgi:hypothetical protein